MKVKELMMHLEAIPQDADVYFLKYNTIRDDVGDFIVNYDEVNNEVVVELPNTVKV